MHWKELSAKALLAEARSRFGDEKVCEIAGVKRNQIHVWGTRGGLPERVRMRLLAVLEAHEQMEHYDHILHEIAGVRGLLEDFIAREEKKR